jgi:DNA adenine methylase
VNLSAPFPWFGGKSRAADAIWQRFGNVPNYVEPFAGSLAVLLSRPHEPRTETVNDADGYLVNFWRAVATAPDEVARWADWPVSELDLHARHKWLVSRTEFVEKLRDDPAFCDPSIAGWWAWGLCGWIGTGWCKLPHLGNAGQGLSRKLPHLGDAGRGLSRQLPHLGNAGQGEAIRAWLFDLADRLRRVRICCGDWSRVVTPAVTFGHGITGVLLDPPYSDEEHGMEYSAHSNVSDAVRAWAVASGENPKLRIALCGYEGEHEMPASWEVVAWKAKGGYGSQGQGRGRENCRRERIWFSPHCLRVTLFAGEATA